MKIAILISALYKHYYYYYYYYYYYWMFFSGSTSLENTTVEKSVSMNRTVNGSSSWSCSSLINPKAGKIGLTVALSLIDPCCFANWKFPHRITCLQNTNFKACFKRPTTAVLSWLNCSCGCSVKLTPLGFRR